MQIFINWRPLLAFLSANETNSSLFRNPTPAQPKPPKNHQKTTD